MKRYIYRFFALLTTVLGAWAFTGCADDVDTSYMTEKSGSFNLVVTVPDEAATRATAEELGFNEFKVKTLHFYFYNDVTGASVYDYVWNIEEFDTQKTVAVPLPANALLEGGLFGTNGTECTVYAVANVDETNLPEGVTLPEGTAKTIAELKALGIKSEFDQTKVQTSFVMDGQATVTIDRTERKATGEITLERAAAKITLSIDVPTTITVPNTTGGTGTIEYTSNTGSMHVWIGNGVKNSMLNTAAEPVTNVDDLYSNAIEATDGKGSAFTKNDAIEKYKYVQNVPFYSYPNKWEATSPDGNCYLTLVLPWMYTDAAGNKQPITTYYRVPVQLKECVIERNMHYDIRVTIGRLGSTDPQEPIDVDVEWNYAIPWNTHGETVDIKQVRYLLLNNNNYDSTITNADGSTTDVYAFDMDNTTEISIPVGTSHDVEIASVTMSWIDYSINPPKNRSITLATPTSNSSSYKYSDVAGYNKTDYFAGIEMKNSTSRLELTRELVHILGSDSDPVWVEGYWDYADYFWEEDVWVEGYWQGSGSSITENDALNSYTFDIKLQHVDDKSQTAMVRITQYPPIYITAEQTTNGNTRFVNKNNTSSSVNNVNKGYIYINPRQDPGVYGDNNLGTVHDNFASNQNTYIISVSRFESDNDNDSSNDKVYIIADPRTRSVNNLTYTENPEETAKWSMSDDNNAQLQYYYPADDSSDKERFIAPKLRIASQWGVTFDMTRNGALRRCASYQENGRPAGRWRVPTVAEIEFIASLSCKKYIPFLFGTAENTSESEKKPADYWCASGAVLVDNLPSNPRAYIDKNGSTATTIRSVRCVYDEWYWGDDKLTGDAAKKFTWGDRPRTTSGN